MGTGFRFPAVFFSAAAWSQTYPYLSNAQQELDTIRAKPFLGTKHMYRKKRFCLQGASVLLLLNSHSLCSSVSRSCSVLAVLELHALPQSCCFSSFSFLAVVLTTLRAALRFFPLSITVPFSLVFSSS